MHPLNYNKRSSEISYNDSTPREKHKNITMIDLKPSNLKKNNSNLHKSTNDIEAKLIPHRKTT